MEKKAKEEEERFDDEVDESSKLLGRERKDIEEEAEDLLKGGETNTTGGTG
jgi:hypothetical protein